MEMIILLLMSLILGAIFVLLLTGLINIVLISLGLSTISFWIVLIILLILRLTIWLIK